MNIENKKQLATLVLAVALGFLAAYLTGVYVKKSGEARDQKIQETLKQQTGALVQKINQQDQQINQLTQQQKALAQQQQAMPKVIADSQKMQAPETKANFALKTPPGKRAMTVLIDSLSAVGGLIGPGDFVDIIGKLKVPDPNTTDASKKKEVVSVLMQNVQVLAVGTVFNPAAASQEYYTKQQGSRSLNITVALDPEEAGLLTFAQENGKLQLSLRSPSENDTQILQVASWDTLSDYVLERQGTELAIDKKAVSIEKIEDDRPKEESSEVTPFIQIFKSGVETR